MRNWCRVSAVKIGLKITLVLLVVAICYTILYFQLFQPKTTVIRISGSTTVYPLAVKWAEEYMRLHKDIKIEVSSGGSGKGITDVLAGLVDVGMSSRDLKSDEINRGALPIPIAYDAVIVVVCINNPVLSELQVKGIKLSILKEIYSGLVSNWEYVIDKDLNGDGFISINATHAININTGSIEGYSAPIEYEIHPYTRAEASGTAETFAEKIGIGDQELLTGIKVVGNPGMVVAVRDDKLGIGYVSLAFAYGEAAEGVEPIPIDFNEDGVIDEGERLDNYDIAIENIVNGKYLLSRALYFVTKHKPTGMVKEFIKWCLTEGQQYVAEVGYVPLPEEKVHESLKLIG